MQNLARLIQLIQVNPFIARVRLGDVAGAEHDRRHPGDLERDVVRDVQARVRRSRVSAPEPA